MNWQYEDLLYKGIAVKKMTALAGLFLFLSVLLFIKLLKPPEIKVFLK